MSTDNDQPAQRSAAADLDEYKLEEATDAAVRMLRNAPDGQVIDEERVRRLARQVAENPTEFTEGAAHAQAVMMALGLPVPRILLADLVECCAAPAAAKREFREKVANLSEITETGSMCFEVKTPAGPVKAFVALDECPDGHDLGAELDKIYRLVPEDKKPQVLEHVSAIVNAGRSVFGRVVVAHAKFVQDIVATMPDGFEGAQRFRLQLDPSNTTFSLPPPCSKRVGVIVRVVKPGGPGQ